MQELFKHIGLVAVGVRSISSGLQFEGLFPSPDNVRDVLLPNGDVDETVQFMADYIIKYAPDTSKIAELLKGKTLKETCNNVWNFVYRHIQYKLDKEGEEQLRRPALLWSNRYKGGDCDCMTIFVCSILYNLKIPFIIRITKYDGNSNFQHVYPIVPINTGGHYTLDCVVSKFDYEKPYSEKKDFTMTALGIPIIGLHGIPTEIESLVNGLGAVDSTEQAVYNHLVKTREIIKSNPGIISKVDYEPAFLEMLDYAIKHYWTPQRDEAFKNLAWNEAAHNSQSGIGEEELLGTDDENDTLQGFDELDGVVDGDDLYEFDGLGRTKTPKKQRKAQRKQQKAEKKVRKAANKKNPKKAAKKLRKADKKIAKGFFRKTGVVLAKKADRKALLKHNPVLISQQDDEYSDNDVVQDDVVDNSNIENDNTNTQSSAIPENTDNSEVIENTPESTDETVETADNENSEDSENTENVDNVEVNDENVSGLLGLGKIPKGHEQEIYRHLIATRDIINKHPNLINPKIDYAPGFLDMLNYAIKYYWTPKRDEALRVLALNEARYNKLNGVTENDLLGYDYDGTDGIVDYDNVYEFDGLGNLGDKNKRKKIKAERKAERKQNSAKNKEERKHAKGFFRKVGVALKQGAKTFKKLNPALIAMRNSFLLVMKINLFGLAAKAKWGYATPEQVKAAGISDSIYTKSKKFVSQLEKLLADKAGGSKVSLKRNILTSKKARLGDIINLSGPEAAPVVAALPLITAVVKLLQDNGLLSKKEADNINKKVDNQDINVSPEDAKELDNIQKDEANNDATPPDNDPDDKKSILSTIWDSAKEHPVLAVGITFGGLLLCGYAFVPPFKKYVNGILKIGKKPQVEPQVSGCHTNSLEGIGKIKSLPTSKAPAKPKKMAAITLK